jgi:hypothetical protein
MTLPGYSLSHVESNGSLAALPVLAGQWTEDFL